MTSSTISRLAEIEKEIKEAIENSKIKENKQNIINGITDSIYWVNTYQLIESRREELKNLGFEENNGTNTHFIEDVENFYSKLIKYVNTLSGLKYENIIATDLDSIGQSGFYRLPNININIPSQSTGPIKLNESKSTASKSGIYILNNIYKMSLTELFLFNFLSNSFVKIPLPACLVGTNLSVSSMFALNDYLFLVSNTNDAEGAIVHRYNQTTCVWDEIADCSHLTSRHYGRNIVFTGGIIGGFFNLGILVNDAFSGTTDVYFINELSMTGNRNTKLVKSFDFKANVLDQGNVTRCLLNDNFEPEFYLMNTLNHDLEILKIAISQTSFVTYNVSKFNGYDPAVDGNFSRQSKISHYDDKIIVYNLHNDVHIFDKHGSVPKFFSNVPTNGTKYNFSEMTIGDNGYLFFLGNLIDNEIVKYDFYLNGYFKVN